MNVVSLVAIMRSTLDTYDKSFKEINFEDKYPNTELPGVRSVRTAFGTVVKSPESRSKLEASRYCQSIHGYLFLVTPSLDLEKVFVDLGVSTVWTSTVVDEETNQLVDEISGLAPYYFTKHGQRLPGMNLDQLPAQGKAHIVLTRSGTNQFSYVVTPDTQSTEVLCVMNRSFPYRLGDITSLRQLRNLIREQLQHHQEENYAADGTDESHDVDNRESVHR